jgi:hypothetical protein
MTDIREAGEPMSRGRTDRRAADARVLRTTVVAVALLTGIVLANGILVIFGIELFEAMGIWPTPERQPSAP